MWGSHLSHLINSSFFRFYAEFEDCLEFLYDGLLFKKFINLDFQKVTTLILCRY
jgi:hypothetical protein